MTTKKTFTDDEGNKYELTPALKTDENIMTLKPIPKAVERKDYFVKVKLHDLDLEHEICETEWITEPQAQAVADAVKALLSFVTNADDYNTRWYDMTVAADAAHEALQHGAERNT